MICILYRKSVSLSRELGKGHVLHCPVDFSVFAPTYCNFLRCHSCSSSSSAVMPSISPSFLVMTFPSTFSIGSSHSGSLHLASVTAFVVNLSEITFNFLTMFRTFPVESWCPFGCPISSIIVFLRRSLFCSTDLGRFEVCGHRVEFNHFGYSFHQCGVVSKIENFTWALNWSIMLFMAYIANSIPVASLRYDDIWSMLPFTSPWHVAIFLSSLAATQPKPPWVLKPPSLMMVIVCHSSLLPRIYLPL